MLYRCRFEQCLDHMLGQIFMPHPTHEVIRSQNIICINTYNKPINTCKKCCSSEKHRRIPPPLGPSVPLDLPPSIDNCCETDRYMKLGSQ